MIHLIATMTKQARTQLAQAIEAGDMTVVERLLNSGQQILNPHGLGHAVQEEGDVVGVQSAYYSAATRALDKDHLELRT